MPAAFAAAAEVPINRFIDVLPRIFVVLGIFGTFIGISMALPEIAKVDVANVQSSGESLTAFVLSVTFAMKTSIAGILFSLVMTFLNTFAPVAGVRKKTFKRLVNCIENIWFTIHGDKSLEHELNITLPDILLELRKLTKNIDSEDTNYKKDFKRGA